MKKMVGMKTKKITVDLPVGLVEDLKLKCAEENLTQCESVYCAINNWVHDDKNKETEPYKFSGFSKVYWVFILMILQVITLCFIIQNLVN